MICSQEAHPITHVSPPKKKYCRGIKDSTMIKRKRIKQFKRLKAPYMNNGTQNRKVEHAAFLLEKKQIHE